MARRGSAAIALVIAPLLLMLARSASAGPAPFGAYIGCYTLDTMGLTADELRVRSSGANGWRGCASTCAAARASLVIVGTSARNYECRCGFSVPPNSARRGASNCEPGGTDVAVFYRHAAATSQQCRVFQPSTTTNNFRTGYNPQNAVFTSSSVRLLMNGFDGGSRVASTYPCQTYGQFQVRAQVPCGSGLVSAFYLRSSDSYPNYGNFDEVDFEYITYNGKPCSLWLNSWQGSVSNGETQFGTSDYRPLLGWSSTKTTTSWATYTLDWQPGYIAWYVDGKLLKYSRAGDYVRPDRRFQVPTLPMRPTFSLWTDKRPNPFGGALDSSKGPWTATFKFIRQVVCDAAAPATTPLGPSWMYR